MLNFGIVCGVSMSGVMWIEYFCMKNRHVLISLAEALSDFDTFEKPPGYDEFNAKMNLLSKVHLVYVTSGSLMYFIVFAPMHIHNCELLNIKRNYTEPCALIAPIYVPFVEYSDLVTYPNVYIINCIQFLMLVYMYTTCGTVIWMNIEMVEYIRHRIRHLKAMMLSAFEKTDAVARRCAFNVAVKYHEEILRYVFICLNRTKRVRIFRIPKVLYI